MKEKTHPDQAVIWVGPIMKNKQNKQCKYNTYFLFVNLYTKK